MDLFDLVATLTLDTSQYDKKLNEEEQNTSKFGKGWKIAGAAAASGIGAATAAVGYLTKKSVESYKDYEQLAGGVKKLYGDSADELMNYANNAYATSGMSANKYMEQATSFSAALINSLGGDTSKAAKQTDVAMRAISDNFNTFGGDIQNVQNAFQGFAKQNYSMLDNLKLGYGGTKTEMERLIADANEYAASIGQASNLSIESFSDIVTAIDLVQQKQGIAGTTAKEAATTIEGSLNMTKAAWENLIAGLANPDADMAKLMDNLIVAIVGDKQGTGLLNQLIPAVQRAVEGIGKFLQSAIPLLASKLPDLIQTFLPVIVESLTTLVASLIQALPSIISTLIKMIPKLIKMILSGLDAGIAPLEAEGRKLIQHLLNAIKNGILSAAKSVMSFAKKITDGIKSGLGSLVNVGKNLIEGLWSGIKAKFDSVISRVKELASRLPKAVKKVLGIASPSKVFIEIGKWIPEGLAEGIERNMKAVYSASDIMAGATAFAPKTNKISNTNSGNIIINLNYNASDDANDMLSDLVKGVRRYRMAGAI